MNDIFEVAFLGTNGSCSFNNGKRLRYGTNTLCTAVRAGGKSIIFDAGSGICGFGDLKDFHNQHLHLFLSHYHVDHINGMLFWGALFNENIDIDIYGIGDLYAIMSCFLKEPYQPVGFGVFRANVNYNYVKDGEEIDLGDGVTVKSMYISHPGDCTGYRVNYNGKSVCYLTDIELSNHVSDNRLIDFVSGCDLLIADASFSENQKITGWGHSTPSECAQLAKNANVKKLALYHYGYLNTDEEIDGLVKVSKKTFENTFASADRQRIVIA